MTRAYIESENGRYLLALSGHATGDERVCAAISGLAYALAGYLENAEEHVSEVYTRKLEPGRVLLHVRGDACVRAVWELCTIGLLQLEKAYPGLISVEIRDTENPTTQGAIQKET